MKAIYADMARGQLYLQSCIKKLLSQEYDINTLEGDDYTYNPLLYAYFNHKKLLPSLSIEQYVSGYRQKQLNHGPFLLQTNATGIAYAPNIGYFKTSLPNAALELSKKADKYTLVNSTNKQIIPFELEALHQLGSYGIEVLAYDNPVLNTILANTKTAASIRAKVANKKLVSQYSTLAAQALEIIATTAPSTLEKVLANFEQAIFVDALESNNFSAIDFQGAIFLGPKRGENSVMWFVDSIIHETAHTNLNLAFVYIQEYFSIDPFELKFSSPFRPSNNKRGLYHVIHAIYVITELAYFFDKQISQLKKTDNYYYEAVGRLVMYIQLLKKGLTSISDKTLYKEKGLILYNYFTSAQLILSKKHQTLVASYALPKKKDGTLTHIFDYNEFLTLNQLN